MKKPNKKGELKMEKDDDVFEKVFGFLQQEGDDVYE